MFFDLIVRVDSNSPDGNLDPDADFMKPPKQSVVVQCIHCGEEYDSYRIEWRVIDGPDGPQGFWCCPIEGCDGAGFGFDIFPVDPDVAAQFGIMYFEDDEEECEASEENATDSDRKSSDDPPPGDEDIPY